MSGGMFAAHTESGGELVEIDGKLYKQFYGIIFFKYIIIVNY